jgi:uncharacterized protein
LIALALALAIDVLPPKPAGWVTDAPGLLAPATRTALNARLKAYRNNRGPDVVVWIAKELPPEPRETWCFRTFNAWGIGDKARNDGVVLFVFAAPRPAQGQKACWITTGAGLMTKLPNAEAVRICREIVAPAVRAGQAEEGILHAVQAILAALDAGKD